MNSIARKMMRRLLITALALLVFSPVGHAGLKGRSASASSKPSAIPAASFRRFSAVSQPRVPAEPVDVLKTSDLALPPAAMAHADAPQGKSGQGPEGAKGGPLGDLPKQVEGQIEASADPKGSDESAAGAIDNAARLLQGGETGGPNGEVGALAAASGNEPAQLAKAGQVKPAPAAEVPAAEAKQSKAPKPINSLIAYKVTRFVLAAIATHWGVIYPMPPATPALTQKILDSEARDVHVVNSDIDDTLTKLNTKLSSEMSEEIVLVRRAGKVFAAITDRPDYAKPGTPNMGALETMSAIPADQRDGVIVVTNGGGKIYEGDANGEWKLIHKEDELPAEQRPLIEQAAEAVKARLPEFGTGIYQPNPGGLGPYGYAMILNPGTPKEKVTELARVFQAELRALNLDYEVDGRSPGPNPPYLTFSKLNKSVAVRRIIELKKLQGKKALGMGDNMYAPQKSVELAGWRARTAPLALRLGAWLSGRPVPQTGNRTDANMELGNPGMLMLSVGGTADPRMPNGYVLSGRGPEQSLQILRAVSSAKTPAAADPDRKADIMAALFIAYILGSLAVIGTLGYRLMYDGYAQAYYAISSIPDQMRMHP